MGFKVNDPIKTNPTEPNKLTRTELKSEASFLSRTKPVETQVRVDFFFS